MPSALTRFEKSEFRVLGVVPTNPRNPCWLESANVIEHWQLIGGNNWTVTARHAEGAIDVQALDRIPLRRVLSDAQGMWTERWGDEGWTESNEILRIGHAHGRILRVESNASTYTTVILPPVEWIQQ
jgi:hypothetical protein